MVDIEPLTTFLFEIFKVTVLGALSALIPLAIKWVIDRTKLDELLGEDVVRKNLESILERSVTFGLETLEVRFNDLPKAIEVKNDILAVAAKYAIQSAPDALKRFGIDPYTAEGQARLQAMLVVRFAEAIGIKDTTKAIPVG